jgi:glutamate-1-semialdehyde 2,1-aminomutase
MIEPIAGNMNFVRASVPFMTRLRELCTQHGALLVFDEVMTGFRVGAGQRAGALRQAHPGLQARHDASSARSSAAACRWRPSAARAR